MGNATDKNKFFAPDRHDFGDGRGPVPAHRHPYGGGWVAETSRIAKGVFLGPSAKVFGYAGALEGAKIGGSAEVFGQALVRGNACVGGRAVVRGNALVEGDVVLEGECLIGAGTHLKGEERIGGHETVMETTRCLECPLMYETYGSVEECPCEECHAAWLAARHGGTTRAMLPLSSVGGRPHLANAVLSVH